MMNATFHALTLSLSKGAGRRFDKLNVSAAGAHR